MPYRLLPAVISARAWLGFSTAATAIGTAVTLDIGGAIAAALACLVGLTTSAVGYGLLRGKVSDHERRLNANDVDHTAIKSSLDAHRKEFSAFAIAVTGDLGELVGRQAARSTGHIHTRIGDSDT